MCIKIYFSDAYYYTYICNQKGEIIDKEGTLKEMIEKHGEPIKFMIMVGV